MKGYKGFNPGLSCGGKQYQENTIFEEKTAIICESGMHFCQNPFDVLDYYPFVNNDAIINDFAEVEALDEVETDDNKKYTTRKLKVGAKIGITGLVNAFVDYTIKKTNKDNADKCDKDYSAATNTGYCSAATNTGNRSAATNTGCRSAATNTGYYSAATNTGNRSAATNTGNRSAATNTGDYSAATNTGNCSAATNTGNRSAATNTGNRSAATNTGYCSAATNTGDYSAATNTGNRSATTNTGYCSAATNTGYQSAATNTGYRSAATSTGDYSAATNTGNHSAASVSGKNSFAFATGVDSTAKGEIGCYIGVAEWKEKCSEYELVDFKTAKVDGKIIKANTFYKLVNGEFTESEEE